MIIIVIIILLWGKIWRFSRAGGACPLCPCVAYFILKDALKYDSFPVLQENVETQYWL